MGVQDGPEYAYAARQILDASKRLQEQVDARTEPDVVLDFGPSGLVVIEVKYLSGNDRKDASYRGWDRYLPRLSRGGMEVRQSGFYELTRLCLLARELAEQRPWVLVNLAFPRVLDTRRAFRLTEIRQESPEPARPNEPESRSTLGQLLSWRSA